jgi:hypothetical protein
MLFARIVKLVRADHPAQGLISNWKWRSVGASWPTDE